MMARTTTPPEWFKKLLTDAREEDLVMYFKKMNFRVNAGLPVESEQIERELKARGMLQ